MSAKSPIKKKRTTAIERHTVITLSTAHVLESLATPNEVVGRNAIEIHRRVKAWASALRRASDEHGRPNKFSVTELAAIYPGCDTRGGYYVGFCRLDMLWAELGGREGWGSCPTYAKGWFYV